MKRLLRALRRAAFRLLAPTDLRGEFGRDIEALFDSMLEDAARRGPAAMVRLLWVEVRQLATTVPALSRGAGARSAMGVRARELGDALRTDARIAASALRRRPVFTASVIATLAAGVGLTAAVYAAARASVLAPLPIEGSERMVVVTGFESTPQWTGRTGLTVRELRALAQQTRTLEALALFSLKGDATVTSGGIPHRLRVTYVSPEYFDLLGAAPALGRTFVAADREGPPTAVLAHHTWVARFGRDPGVLGKDIDLAGTAHTVVGVMPESHWGLSRGRREFDAWVPLAHSPPVLGADVLTSFYRGPCWGVAKLRDGVSPEEAEYELAALHAAFAAANPIPVRRSTQVIGLRDFYFGAASHPLEAVSLGAVLLLLVCFTNVALLTSLRHSQRHPERLVRSALGERRRRELLGSLTEGWLLGTGGAACAVPVAAGAVAAFEAFFGDALLHFRSIALDPPLILGMLAASTALATGASLLISGCDGRGARPPLTPPRKSPRRWPVSTIIALEAALAMVVTVAAALGARSLSALRSVELGYEPAGLHSARLTLVGSEHERPGGPAAFTRSIVERLEARGIAAGAMGPDMMGRSVTHIHAIPSELDPSDRRNVTRLQWISVTPGTLRALGAELVEGRDVAWRDAAGAEPVVVISERTAQLFWPGESAVGKRMYLHGPDGATTVVAGVVRDARHTSRYAAPYTAGDAYLPFAQRPTPSISLLYRSVADHPFGDLALEDVVREVAPQVPLFDRSEMSERVEGEEATLRLVVLLLTAYGSIALVLAGCGIVSLIATAVGQRRPEIAIRSALGSPPRSLIWACVRGPTTSLLLGVFAGAGAAAVFTPYLEAALFRVSPTDLPTYATVGTALVAGGLTASWLPARRATRIAIREAVRD